MVKPDALATVGVPEAEVKNPERNDFIVALVIIGIVAGLLIAGAV